ncbi:MAG: glycoside hydrolase family 16 protein [Bacteroidales bacterium]|nr:glycoside hydrolase family 16 protein [Bacteroidales bacterium]
MNANRIARVLPLLCALSLLSGCGTSPRQAFLPTSRDARPTEYEGMTLVWHDEFDTPGRPGPDWSYERGFVRNQEHQWYQEENCFVEDGVLVLEARRETVENPQYDPNAPERDWKRSRKVAEYTSGSVNTRNSFTFKYGKLEVRAKISVEKGSWPAIWTLGNHWGWPFCGEIDVMEYYLVRDTPTILANAAWGSENGGSEWRTTHHPLSRFLEKDPEWVEKYHVWMMDWTPDRLVLSLDGEVLNTVDLSETVNGGFRGNTENPFSNDHPDFAHYILLDYAIGGQNGGDPSGSSWPQRYCIDYVRVYQKTN